MFKNQNFNYAVFGNPIDHSKSPEIHNFFSKQTGIFHNYASVNVPLDQFSYFLSNFFKKNGKGANITAPFKEEAYLFCNKLTERAKIARSVNTIKKINDKYILGDNTDGVGLLSDLIRLNFIKKNDSVLILGAGGVVRGILFPLLSFGCSVFILNRTLSKAEKLVIQFSRYGKINIFDNNFAQEKHFDLIINATSKYNKNNDNIIDLSCISSKTCFYDINYKNCDISFFDLYIKMKSNGIGMLVLQAAHSFFLWHNIFPETNYIINILKNIKQKK